MTEKMSNETFKVNCDYCEHKFELHQKDIHDTKIDKVYDWRFFECPNCRMRYTTFIGNKTVNDLIRDRNTYRRQIKNELDKGSNMNQNRYHAIRIQDEHAATKIQGLTRKLKKELNISEREKEFLLVELGKGNSSENSETEPGTGNSGTESVQ